MITSFGDDATRDVFHGVKSKAARKQFPMEVVKVVKRKLDALHAATQLGDLTSSGNRLEDLKYTMPGYYSVRVNDRFRITFQWANGNAFDVRCWDYHPPSR
jgi:toxin HigB-1